MTPRVVIFEGTDRTHAVWEGAVPDMGELVTIDTRTPNGAEHLRLRVIGRQWRVTRHQEQGRISEGVLSCFVFVVPEGDPTEAT